MKLDAATIVLVLAILVTLHVGPSSSSISSHGKEEDYLYAESEKSPSQLRGTSKLSAGVKYYPPSGKDGAGRMMTCDKYPRVCHVRGSPGPDCCKKKCVNVNTDSLNCGMCGYKCRHQETCCNGRCVNPLYDRKHCGGCGNKCNKGDVCHYGMCSYA